MHLADAFIQSDLQCIQVTVSTLYQNLKFKKFRYFACISNLACVHSHSFCQPGSQMCMLRWPCVLVVFQWLHHRPSAILSGRQNTSRTSSWPAAPRRERRHRPTNGKAIMSITTLDSCRSRPLMVRVCVTLLKYMRNATESNQCHIYLQMKVLRTK